MQQRQLRLGDILDDYCPRERRVTNHAIVAMIGSTVKQTRCTTCDAEHEYKGAKVPALRKKREAPAALYDQVLTGVSKGPGAPPISEEEAAKPVAGRLLADDSSGPPALPVQAEQAPLAVTPSQEGTNRQPGEEEDPVQRPLIRATLPRTEGTALTRQIPEFTIRQNGGRAGKFRVGAPHRQRPAGGGASHSGGGVRHGGRPGMPGGQGGRTGTRPPSLHQRPAHHPRGPRVARPGKKRSR